MVDRVVRVRLVGDAKSLISETKGGAKALQDLASVSLKQVIGGLGDVDDTAGQLKKTLIEQAKQGEVTGKSLGTVYDGLQAAGGKATTSAQGIITTLSRLGDASDQTGKDVGKLEDGFLSADDAARAADVALGGIGQTLKDQSSAIQANARDWAGFEKALSGLGSTLDKQTGALTQSSRELAAQKIPAEFLRSLEQAGVSTSTYLDAVLGAPPALAEMRRALSGNEAALSDLARAQNLVKGAQDDFQLRQRAIGEVSEGTARNVHQAAGLIDRAGDASRGATPLVGGLGSAFDRARTAMIALFAADQFVDFIREAVGAASDFEQSVGAVGAVFVDTKDQIEEFAQTSATQIGIARGEYQNMAAIFGAQLKNMGVSATELVPTTNKLITLGADLAAQFGGTTSEAVEALGALLRGERDPIERYGVGIKDAGIKARLAAEGLDGLTGAAGRQAQLQATLALLWEQTGSAQGAFSRELDTLATKQQIANAQFEHAKEEIGAKLLPLWSEFTSMLAADGVPALEAVGRVFGDILGLLAPVVGFFADMPGPVQAAAIALGAVVLLNGPLVRLGGTLASIATGAGAATAGVTRFAFSMKTLMATLGGPIGLAIVGVTTALSFMGGESDDTAVSVEGLAAVVDDATGKLKTNAQELAVSAVVSSGLAEQYVAMGGRLEDLIPALLGNADAQSRVNAKSAEFEKYAKTNDDIDLAKRFTEGYSSGLNTIADAQNKGALTAKLNEENQKQLAKVQAESADSAEDSKAKWEDLSDAQKLASDSAKLVSEKLKDAAEQAKLLADSTEASKWLSDFKGQADDAARAADILKAKIDGLDGRSRSLDDATASQVSSLAALRKAFEDGTKAAKDNQEAGNLNTQALADWNVAALNATSDGRNLYSQLSSMSDAHTDLVAAAYSSAVAEGDVAGAADRAQEAAKNSRAAFIELAAQYLGGNTEAAAALADKLGILDEQKVDDKTFEVIGDDAKAQDAVDRANQAVVNDKLFQIRADAVDALVQAQNLNETLSQIDGKEVRWFAIGNVVVSVSQQELDAANAKAANFGYAPTDYSKKAGGGWIGLAGGGFSEGTSGWVRGPGGPTDDLVVAQGPGGTQVRVSADEFVTRGSIARQVGPFLEALNSGSPLAMALAGVIRRAGGGFIGLAAGGSVGAAGAGTGMSATLAGEVTAPDPDAIQAAWDLIAGGIESTWTGRILPVMQAMSAQNLQAGVDFTTLAATFQQQQAGVIQPTYDALNVGTQGVGTWQQWLAQVWAQSWQSNQERTAAGVASIGASWSALSVATDAAWSSIGARIQGTYDGQIVPAWNGVQGFASETGSFFAGIQAGVQAATDSAISNIGEIRTAMDEFFAMVEGKVAANAPAGPTTVTVGTQGFAAGGVLPGVDTGRDNQLFAGRSGEAIMVPQFTDAVGGAAGVHRLNRLAESGMFQGFATGGVIGEKLQPGIESVITQGFQSAVEAVVTKAISGFAAVGGFASNGQWGPGTDGSGLAANAQAAKDFITGKWGITNIGGVYGGSVPGSDHPIGKALDVMIDNYLSAAGIDLGTSVADWFVQNPSAFGTKYVIWRDRINEGGSWAPYQHPSGSNDTLQHRDHVHLSFLTGTGQFSGAPTGLADDNPERGGWLGSLLQIKAGGRGASTIPGDSSARTMNTVDPIVDFGPMNMARGTMAMVGPVPNGGAEERWAGMVADVLAKKGKSTNNSGNAMYQMHTESGGDPLAYNDWDRNFTAGHPSKSLWQTIPSTFKRYADPGFDTNIWHPESNFRAAVNYVDANYGGVFPGRAYRLGGPVVGPGGPYDDMVNARLSNGEFVVNASSAAANLPLLQSINSGGFEYTRGQMQSSAANIAAGIVAELAQLRDIVARVPAGDRGVHFHGDVHASEPGAMLAEVEYALARNR